ncbi:MAG: VWA domain-containing protein [Acidobacteria bacterium]|nr:VWA domain-containing protein [Acidobacteriota bacterium]MDA1235993.1 VWA domain-containing protein [Acidobacteriota bacterium]
MRKILGIGLGLAAATAGLVVYQQMAWAQTSGPIGGPRRPPIGGEPRPPGRAPAPNGPASDAPINAPDLSPIETRARRPQATPGEVPLFTSDTNYVTVDISVVDSDGVFIPNIPQGNFQILEDGVPQKIVNFGMGEGESTVCLLIEFSNLFQQYWSETWYQTLTAAYGFIETLRPEDYVAVVAYDLRPEILTDFTQDRREIQGALNRLKIPGYSESNLFDALGEMIGRMKDIEGRKSIVVLASGRDTLSKYNLKQIRQVVQEGGVTIHTIGLMQAMRDYYDSRGAMGSIARMDFLQADNQMRTFSRESGGLSFFPRFYGEFPNIFQLLNYVMRNQYTAVYQPNNTLRNGEFRKIEVRLVAPTGKELRVTNEKGKRVKYQVVHKQGYIAPREVE